MTHGDKDGYAERNTTLKGTDTDTDTEMNTQRQRGKEASQTHRYAD